MAINPGTLYPTKTLPASSPNWPYGEPKNIVAAGDGTGTPWEIAVVKDLMGMQQALLIRAGITPTGTPETADVSQYVDAMQNLAGRQLGATTDILTTVLNELRAVQTLGYAAAGDGGGTLWIATGVTIGGSAGTSDFPAGFIYDDNGRQFAIAPGEINPRQFGAVGDAVANDQPAFQAVATLLTARGGGVARVTKGTYFCNAQITTGDKVSWRGDGPGTIVTFFGAGGSFPNGACFYGAGSSAAIADLDADLDPDATQITFAAAHTLAEGDLFYINDPRANSYGSLSAGFRAGEFCVVSNEVSSTVVDLEQPIYATLNPVVNTTATTYKSAEVDVKKVTPIRMAIRDMTIIGVADNAFRPPIQVHFGRECRFERLNLSKSVEGGILPGMCYDLVISDIVMASDVDQFNGVNISYCQRVTCNNLRGGGLFGTVLTAEASGHADGVVNREIVITNCSMLNRGSSQTEGVRVKQNAEYVTISDCRFSGVRLGGNHHRISDCQIQSWKGNPAIRMDEMTGTSIQISDCKITQHATVALGMLNFDNGSNVTPFGGTISITDTILDARGIVGDLMTFVTRDTTERPTVEFTNLRVIGSNTAGAEVLVGSASNAGWAAMTFRGCMFHEVDLDLYGAEFLNIESCSSFGAPSDAYLVSEPPTSPFSTRYINILGGQVFEAHDAGFKITDRFAHVRCVGLMSLRNNQNSTKSNTRSSFVFDVTAGGDTELTLANCVFGDEAGTPTQTFGYMYDDIGIVRDLRTVVLGGTLPVTRNALVDEKIVAVWTNSLDEMKSTGALGIDAGDPDAAPVGADELVIGSGTGSKGAYIKSSPTGISKIAMGDGSNAERFKIEGDHANDELDMSVLGVIIARCAVAGFEPGVHIAHDLGSTVKRWLDAYVTRIHTQRVMMDFSNIPDASDFVLSGSWGTSASVSSVRGRDPIVEITITAGTASISANPTFTYTYPDGAAPSSNAPMVFLQSFGALNTNGKWHVVSQSSTAVVVRFVGTPTVSSANELNLLLLWGDG